MRGKYTLVPADTFKQLGLNAGIMAKNFNPATGEVSGLMGATTGGLSFESTPNFQDFGDDVDNCPKNSKELKEKIDETVHVSGTLLTLSNVAAKSLMAGADIDQNDTTKIIPRSNLVDADFEDVWIIIDYSDKNTGADAGFIAIHLRNCLNTGGFKVTTGDQAKAQYAFDYMAHTSLQEPDVIPYEVYVKSGSTTAPSIELNTHMATVVEEESVTLTATTIPVGETVTWTSSNTDKATVAAGVVTAKASSAGSVIITAAITVDGVTYTDTCTVVIEAAE